MLKVTICQTQGWNRISSDFHSLIFKTAYSCLSKCLYLLFWFLIFKCMLLFGKHYRKCCHLKKMLFTNKNANIGRRKEKQCLETTKRESKNLKKTEATVIVNIVIVIGSNNHILISCVNGFWSTLTLCGLQNKTARMFLNVRLECLP